jgi:hypothetical protein
VTLHATPNARFQVGQWSGVPCGTATFCTITVNGNVNASATFNNKTYAVLVSGTGVDFLLRCGFPCSGVAVLGVPSGTGSRARSGAARRGLVTIGRAHFASSKKRTFKVKVRLNRRGRRLVRRHKQRAVLDVRLHERGHKPTRQRVNVLLEHKLPAKRNRRLGVLGDTH